MASVKLLDPTDPKNKLDRYELIGELAAGGMAVVYLARIAGLGGFQRFVAIKRLHPHLAQEDEFIEMFLDEARLAASIHNPHVVPILEVGVSEQGHYLVMEYIEGDTLARVASRAAGRITGKHPAASTGQHARPRQAPASMPSGGPPIPRPVTVRILLDALAGLHAAHEHTDPLGNPLLIVHRDISPQNILVGVDGSARITDFGVARAASRLSTTRSDTVKGKLAYLSPEQSRGDAVDRRSDLFAMGIILWEMLTGRRLFRGESDQETIARINNAVVPPPSTLVPGMHPALDAVVLRALARDVSQRYSTCAEMADALERAATEAAASTGGAGVAQPREVAAFMNDILGQEIAQQREGIRVWLAQRNDPALVSVRAAPPPQGPQRTQVNAIVAPLPPPPPLLAGVSSTSTSLPPPGTAPVIAAPAPDDGDPTTLRVVSGLTQGAMAMRSGSPIEATAPQRARGARIAGLLVAAALLAVGVVWLLRPGAPPQGEPTPAAASAASSAPAGVPSAQAPPPPSSAAAGSAPPAETAPVTTAEPASTGSAEPETTGDPAPTSRGRWKAPATAAPPPATSPAATATAKPAATAKPPGDDFSNPYK